MPHLHKVFTKGRQGIDFDNLGDVSGYLYDQIRNLRKEQLEMDIKDQLDSFASSSYLSPNINKHINNS